jgi:hypothetical protein
VLWSPGSSDPGDRFPPESAAFQETLDFLSRRRELGSIRDEIRRKDWIPIPPCAIEQPDRVEGRDRAVDAIEERRPRARRVSRRIERHRGARSKLWPESRMRV